ncbi:MAG: hypothetical protein NC834_01530 [Candidatus Omnitrophica bacterium]|nr:hypothetical protein [Candidatus Omnitrophota bacterium]
MSRKNNLKLGEKGTKFAFIFGATGFIFILSIFIKYSQEKSLQDKSFPETLRRIKDTSIIFFLEKRNKEGKSNYPLTLQKEEPLLWEKIKEKRIPFYSQKDKSIYVWSIEQLKEMIKNEYQKGIYDEQMTSLITLDKNGIPQGVLGTVNEFRRDLKNRFIFGLNFRQDRQRQWAWAIYGVYEENGKEVLPPNFYRQDLEGIELVTMTRYIKQIPPERFILPDIEIKNGLVEVLNRKNIPVAFNFDREKEQFIPAFRGLKVPFPNEDLDNRSISMPIVHTEKGWKQIPNEYYWLYPGLSMDNVAFATAQKILASRGPLVTVTNLSGADLNCHEATKHLQETAVLWIDEPNYEKVFYGNRQRFEEMVGILEENGLRENLETAREKKTIEVIVGDKTIIEALSLQKDFNPEEQAKIAVNFNNETIRITKLVKKRGTGWDSAFATLSSLDKGAEKILDALRLKNGVAIVVADHGSLDNMTKPGHTAADVPLFVIEFKDGKMQRIELRKREGTQADAAVTVLHLLGIEKPEEMSGESLLPDTYKGNSNRPIAFLIADGYTPFSLPDVPPEMNATKIALDKGLTPTFAKLFKELPYAIVKSAGRTAGLRGGRERDFPKEKIITDRDLVIKKAEMRSGKIKEIELINYDYDKSEVFNYQKGIFALKNSPFLNDRYFVIGEKGTRLVVKYFFPDQYGSTEFNTWTLGAGRIVRQPHLLLDDMFIDGSIFETQAIKNALRLAKEQGYLLITGILQEAAVHASANHLYHLLKYFKENGINKFVFQLATDGRDEEPMEGIRRIEQLGKALVYLGIKPEDYALHIGGREHYFDRARRWDKTREFLNILLYGSRNKPF